ncbi:MarR family transcriptional regulator [Candidatus Woesearchaeota archaeon]|nr:MarR family transcriptional regulator [Candidatus Woesearchaeota archaeon]
MKNKHVGFLVIALALVVFLIVVSFNNAIETIVNTTCTHGASCPMQVTLKTQKMISYTLVGLLVALGLGITFFLKNEQIIVHKEIIHESNPNAITSEEKEKQWKEKIQSLDAEEQQLMNILLREQGSVYQSSLIKETKLTKVKVSRVLDRLEGKGLLERKRRGMTNIVILKS